MARSVQDVSSYLLPKNGLLIKQVLQEVPLFFQYQEMAVLEKVCLPWKPTQLLSCKVAAQLSKTFGLKFFGGKISAPLSNFELQFEINYEKGIFLVYLSIVIQKVFLTFLFEIIDHVFLELV